MRPATEPRSDHRRDPQPQPNLPLSISPAKAHGGGESGMSGQLHRPATRDPLPGHPRAQDLSSSEGLGGLAQEGATLMSVAPRAISARPSARTTMTAVTQDAYGPVSVLETREIAVPKMERVREVTGISLNV